MVVAEQVVGGDPRLVLAHVGEERLAVDVADRVEPVVAGDADVRVDVDRLAGLQADDLEPEVLRQRRAAERDQHLVGEHRAAVGGRDGDRAVVVLLDRLGLLAVRISTP